MPAARKPKKIFVQFAIAMVVAVVFGISAIVVGFMVIQGISTNAEQVQKEAKAKAEAAKAEEEKYRRLQEQLSKTPKSYRVVKTLVDLKPGQTISKEILTLVEVTEKPMPGTLSLISQALGKVVRSPVVTGEPLESSKLLDTGGISVEAGMRAITIEVNNIGGLGGALPPGAHVDVLTTVVKEEEALTRTLLQDVPVVAVNPAGSSPQSNAVRSSAVSKLASPAAGGNYAVTLVVNPAQAELLTLAGQLGGFHLTLRNFSDTRKSTLAGADLTTVMTGLQPATMKGRLPARPNRTNDKSGFYNVNYSPADNLPYPEPDAKAGAKFTMQVYRGTGAETIDFQR